MYLLETALLSAGPGASDGESEIEDGVSAGVSIEGESDWGDSGGDATEDLGVDGEWAGEIIRLPPPLNGAGAGDWATAEEIRRVARTINPRILEIDIAMIWKREKSLK